MKKTVLFLETLKDYKINVVDSGYGDDSHTEAGFQINAN